MINQAKVKNVKNIFEKKGTTIKNALSTNIDTFGKLLISLRVGNDGIFTTLEDFIDNALLGKLEFDFRNNFFDFSENEAIWLLDFSLFGKSFLFSTTVFITSLLSSKYFFHLNGDTLKVLLK